MDGTGKSGKDLRLSLLEKQDKAKRGQISRARQRGEDLVREDLWDAHDLFAFQDQDAHVTPNPYNRHNVKSYSKTGDIL